MQQLSRDLYNLNEWALLRMFRVVTGVKLAYNPELKNLHLLPFGNVEPATVELISELISNEFGLQIETLNTKVEYRAAIRGRFINTSRMNLKLKKITPDDKTTAIMGVTNYWLAPTSFLISQILHTVFPILGITYLIDGICFVTTLNGLLTNDFIEFAAIHEAGHLLGLHGYPLKWLRAKRKRQQSGSD